MSARKKITDKQRLDWMEKRKADATRSGGIWYVDWSPDADYLRSTSARSLRAAIDKAMRAPKPGAR